MADPEKELEDELDLEDVPGDEPEDDQQDDVEASEADAGEAASPEPEQRQPPRRDARIQRLIEEKRRSDAEVAEMRRRLDELTTRTVQPPPQQQHQETEEERAARYEQMSPGQALVAALNEAENRFSRKMAQSTAQTADIADKTAFQTKASNDPLYARWQDRVETKLAEMRAQGTNLNREVLFTYMIGEAAMKRRNSTGGKREVADAGRRVQQRRQRPADSGSDTAPSREERRTGGRDADSRERRLANVQI